MTRWGTAKGILAIAGLVLFAGCVHIVKNDPWMSGDVIGVKKTAPEPDLAVAWRGEADPWKDAEGSPANVIGGESALDGPGAARGIAGAVSSDPRPSNASGLEGELRALAARVDRLERRAGTGVAVEARSAPRAAAPSKRPVDIYKVDPAGQTVWITAGTRTGIEKGRTLDILRGGKAIGVARVVRVWSDRSELAVLWASGKLMRGDTAVPR